MYTTKDSGQREVNPKTGAHRDTQTGKPRYDLLPVWALKRWAELMARGAEKYGDNNWQKGMEQSRFLSSAMRHMFQYAEGDNSEDHLAAVLFNVGALIQQIERVKLGELPEQLLDDRWAELNYETAVVDLREQVIEYLIDNPYGVTLTTLLNDNGIEAESVCRELLGEGVIDIFYIGMVANLFLNDNDTTMVVRSMGREEYRTAVAIADDASLEVLETLSILTQLKNRGVVQAEYVQGTLMFRLY